MAASDDRRTPRELVRAYLVQQREAGDREIILSDSASKALGSINPPPPAAAAANWREALRAADAAPADATRVARGRSGVAAPVPRAAPPPQAAAPEAPPPPRGASSSKPAWHAHLALDQVPHGLTVGSSSRELFEGRPARDGYGSIAEIERAVANCTRCALYRGAKNPVPGEGNIHADLMCVGEAPGAVEDEQGRPFVGPAGKLLTQILAAIGFEREHVYICNVLKHRPPNNRNPLPDEVTACQPYLIRQVELIAPKVILALGTFAAQTLLDTKSPMGKLREAVHSYHGIPLVVTYHPAALLRNPSWKRPTWEDVQFARRLLDRSVPAAAKRRP